MIYKKFLLVSSVMFSASSDSDISYKNIASNQVEKILNSEEMHKALEIFDVIHKYDNQCSFSNIGYTPLYFQYTDDGKFCPRSFFDDDYFLCQGKVIGKSSGSDVTFDIKQANIDSTSSEPHIYSPSMFWTPKCPSLDSYNFVAYNKSMTTGKSDHNALGYQNTQYIKHISCQFIPSNGHTPIYYEDDKEIKGVNEYQLMNGTTNVYRYFIHIQLKDNIGLLSNVSFTWVFDEEDKRFYGFTDLDARIIWNLALQEKKALIESQMAANTNKTLSGIHIESLKNNPFYVYYPNFKSANKPVRSFLLTSLVDSIPSIFINNKILISPFDAYNAQKNRATTPWLNIQDPFYNIQEADAPNYLLPIKVNNTLTEPLTGATL